MQKKFYVLVGNYGSGKTELSINFALNFAKEYKTTLVDLDIVNPYFRSSEKAGLLCEAGIKVIAPVFANKTIDSPSLPPEVASVFADTSERVIFDAGGDPVGATALGRYKHEFDRFEGNIEVLYVINARRPLSRTHGDVCEMLEQIQSRSRLNITGLINNTNLAAETGAGDLLEGQKTVEQASELTGIPIRYVAGWKNVLEAFAARAGSFQGELLPIETRMRPSWQDETIV